MTKMNLHKLGIDIGSTTVKISILSEDNKLLFSDYKRHFANIRETLSGLLQKAYAKLGNIRLCPMITGSGGLALANHLGVPFTQEVIAVATSLQELAPQTDVAIELGGEDAKIIYFSLAPAGSEICEKSLPPHSSCLHLILLCATLKSIP